MTSTAPWLQTESRPQSTAATPATGVEDAASPLHMADMRLELVPEAAYPVYLCPPPADSDYSAISRWVIAIRPLYQLSPGERHLAERAIDETGRTLAKLVETGATGDMEARWLLLAMINQADIAQTAAQSWLFNHRRGCGTGDVEELSDLVRDELHKTVIGREGDHAHAVWQWDRVASTCGWARKIAMRAAQQRKDKLGERNQVRLYGSSESDRGAVFGSDLPATIVAMPFHASSRGSSRENSAGALRVGQRLEFQRVAARMVTRIVGVPDVPRASGTFRVEAAEALASSKASEVQSALRAVNNGAARPEHSEQALLWDLWAATTPEARDALLTVDDPRMCVAWARGQVAARPRFSAAIINQVSAQFKPLKQMRKWTAMCNDLASAYAESVADLPNELTRSAFRAAVEKTDAQLLVDRRRLLEIAQEAIEMWDNGTCPLGDTPEQVEATLRDCFHQIVDDLADERVQNVS